MTGYRIKSAIVLGMLLAVSPAAGAVVQFHGFESQSSTTFTSSLGTFEFSTSVKKTGAAGLRVNPASNGTGLIQTRGYASTTGQDAGWSVATLYASGWFRVDNLPDAGLVEILNIRNTANGAMMYVDIASDGKLSAYRGSDGTTQMGSTSSSGLSIDGQFHLLEVKCGIESGGGGNAVYEVKVDGSSWISGTDGVTGTTNVGYFTFGKQVDRAEADGGVDFFYDDWAFGDAAYPGDQRVIQLTPDGNSATYADWAASAGNKYDCVATANADTSYASNSTNPANYAPTFNSATAAGLPGGATINCVKAFQLVREETAGDTTALQLFLNSTSYITVAADPGAGYALRGKLFATDPSDSNPWTSADIDAIEVGVRATSATATRCTYLSCEVLYTPPAEPTAPQDLAETDHTGTTASFTWGTASGGTAPYTYQLRVSTNGSDYSDVTGAISSPATATELTGATGYWFKVLVTDSTSPTPLTDESNVVTLTTDATLTAGRLRQTAGTATAITVAWADATNNVGTVVMQLQRSAHSAGSWSNVDGATTSPATDTGRTEGTIYDYRVRFVDDETTAYSNTLPIRAGTILTVNFGSGFSGATSTPADKGTAKTFTIDSDTEILTLASPGWTIPTGAVVRVSNSGGALPTGLAASTDYYWRRLSDTTGYLDTKPDAASLRTVSDAGSGTHTATLASASAEVLLQWRYWTIKPFDEFRDLQTVCLIAEHLNGWPTVTVYCEGGDGQLASPWEQVTVNGRTEWAYAVNVPTASVDGQVELRAVGEPQHAGKSRVLQGAPADFSPVRPWPWCALLLDSDAGSTRQIWYAYVDADGASETPVLSQTPATAAADPYDEIKDAVAAIRLKDDGGGALSSSSNTSRMRAVVRVKQSDSLSDVYELADCAAAWTYNRGWLRIEGDPTNTRTPELRMDGWHNYVKLLELAPGVIVGPKTAVSNANLIYPDGTGGNDECIWFGPSEWKDHVLEALGDDWYVCDHLGLGITGATYTASNRRLTKTGAFASYFASWAEDDTVRFSGLDGATPVAEATYYIESATADYVVLLANGGGEASNAPLVDLTACATTANIWRPGQQITGSSIEQVFVSGVEISYLHNQGCPAQYTDNCLLHHIEHGPYQPYLLWNTRWLDLDRATANPGIHPDWFQIAAGLGASDAYYDLNAFLWNNQVYCNTLMQPCSIGSWLKNLSIRNNVITSEDGYFVTAGPPAVGAGATWDFSPNDAIDHWIFDSNTAPCHRFFFQAAGVIFKNCAFTNSVTRLISSNSGDGWTVFRNVIMGTAPTGAPFSTWGTGNIEIVEPFGYPDLQAAISAAAYAPPEALRGGSDTGLLFDCFFHGRTAPSAIGAVSAATEYADPLEDGPWAGWIRERSRWPRR